MKSYCKFLLFVLISFWVSSTSELSGSQEEKLTKRCLKKTAGQFLTHCLFAKISIFVLNLGKNGLPTLENFKEKCLKLYTPRKDETEKRIEKKAEDIYSCYSFLKDEIKPLYEESNIKILLGPEISTIMGEFEKNPKLKPDKLRPFIKERMDPVNYKLALRYGLIQ
ncbi:hypothetical protein RF11_00562 [Thelohanellus kitauei]|uniref:Uncharacterized protein n=1 Tax=Thelohanellus kitauei TaxID=669202 RepID=A0A0C2JXI0_THEKT|nr:hypothetical protein RF11_00562 [Thelohanellus kitauei]